MSIEDQLEAQVRYLENQNRALAQTLWDEFFKAALMATLHHGKVSGVAAAAEVADEALRVRNLRSGVTA